MAYHTLLATFLGELALVCVCLGPAYALSTRMLCTLLLDRDIPDTCTSTYSSVDGPDLVRTQPRKDGCLCVQFVVEIAEVIVFAVAVPVFGVHSTGTREGPGIAAVSKPVVCSGMECR